jgi:dipeptidyl aminopeptidase/acylaminoacyl peptidase
MCLISNTKRASALFLSGLLLCSWLSASNASPRSLVPDDFFRLAEVTEPQLSPDGRSVAYVVSHNDRDTDESVSELWMVAWNGAQPVQLTRSLKDVRAPQWSPDGRVLSFLATPVGGDHTQVMAIDSRGGEAYELTQLEALISSYQWSPNSQQLLLVLQGGAKTEAPPVAPPIVITAKHFKADQVGYLTADVAHHLAVLDISTGHLTELATTTDANDDAPDWSPDGQRIAFIRTWRDDKDAEGKQAIEVMDAKSDAVPHALAQVYTPNQPRLAWALDGRSLITLVGSKPELTAYMSDQLVSVSLADGRLHPLAAGLDRGVVSFSIAQDGLSIDALIEDDTLIYPAKISLRDGAPSTVRRGPEVVLAQSRSAGHTVWLMASDRSAPEIYAFERGKLRRLSHHNEAFLSEIQLGTVEDLRFNSIDGTEVHGLLVKPADYVEGQRYPTILWIHGGPAGEDEHSLLFNQYPLQLERQLLAAHGYVVLAINYRGSSGRGHLFQESIAADWGHKEVEDLLAGIDAVIARGIADPQRLGVGGWSYGGILTDYLITSDQRFKAAVSGAGSGNQLSMYGVDQYVSQYNAEIGAPWKNEALWRKLSYPFFHADRITTPTLFLGGLKDFNVPISGGEQMYQALRTLGVPTELVVYPDQYHIFSRPSYIKDRAERVSDWYDRFLGTQQAH